MQPPRHPAKANAPRRHFPHVRRGLGKESRERKEEAACKTRLAQGKGARTVREWEGIGTIGYETCRRKDSATRQPIHARSALPRAAGEAGNSSGCASNFQLPKPEAQHLPLELRGSLLPKPGGISTGMSPTGTIPPSRARPRGVHPPARVRPLRGAPRGACERGRRAAPRARVPAPSLRGWAPGQALASGTAGRPIPAGAKEARFG